MIQNITVRIHPEWKGKIADLSKTAEEMKSNPGVTENSAILSKESVTLSIEHPYKELGKTNQKYEYWKGLEPTQLQIGPNTLCAKPYAWLMFNMNNGRCNPLKNWVKYGLSIEKNREKSWYVNGNFGENNFVNNALNANAVVPKTGFLQLGNDQNIVFDKFFCNIKKEESLCFVYAKWAEFTELPQRILVGIGHVLDKQVPPQYEGDNEIECRLWETRLQHSIEKDGDDCVLLPYDELQSYAENIKDFNIDDYVVFASDDFRDEYSYGTEWLSYDGAVDTILRTKNILKKLEDLFDKSFEKQQRWLDQQLEKIYEDRWIYPGLGEMLYAFGLENNWQEISEKMIVLMKNDGVSFREALCQTIRNYTDQRTREIFRQWNDFVDSKKELFELLSRMSLSEKHAKEFFVQAYPYGRWNEWVDAEAFLKNPYLVYELFPSKNSEDELPFVVVDNAMYPQYILKECEKNFEISGSSKMENAEDLRRVHALMVKVLKCQIANGNSIYPAKLIRDDLAKEVLRVQCSPDFSVLENTERLMEISDTFKRVPLIIDGEDSFGFQLKRCIKNKDIIKDAILCLKNESENFNEDWNVVCESLDENTENQRDAKTEKINILSKMASSKIFVLTGGAGTGKTTLLSLFTSSEEIRNGGVLALAPTGKAMVRMREAFGNVDEKFKFKTIASFLMPFNRYNPVTGKYDYTKDPSPNARLPMIPSTVIIDECSMLTEDMLAALLKTIENDADRIILSGDANQLPPIGCGRPFLDILTYFKKEESNSEQPNLGNHFGELQISMRQNGENRSDLAFAQCFKRSCSRNDLRFFRQESPNDEWLKIKTFGGTEDLETSIYDALNNDLKIEPSKILVESDKAIDDWEILSPTRNDKFGSLRINEIVRKSIPTNDVERTISEEFIPVQKGDKVICVVNRNNDTVFPPAGNNIGYNYVANGDIGYVSEIELNNRRTYHVVYNGQNPYYHKYHDTAFKNDSNDNSPLEYAYALTVHKCQGSQFGKTLVVLNKNSLMLTRELLYTAFSRQKDKLVVLFNGDFHDLKKYCDFTFSAVAKRLTNLMEDVPNLIVKNGECFDERYTKQDAEVTSLYKEQIEKEKRESTHREDKPIIAETEYRETGDITENTSIFGNFLNKIKSFFVR